VAVWQVWQFGCDLVSFVCRFSVFCVCRFRIDSLVCRFRIDSRLVLAALAAVAVWQIWLIGCDLVSFVCRFGVFCVSI
jgi:hypothetical protein